MRRLFVPLLTGLALIAGPGVLAAPASAETLVITDAKKDVRSLKESSTFGPKEPSVRDHDIVRSRINHGPRALVVRVKHRSLTGPKSMQATGVRIITSKGEEYLADWRRTKGAGTIVVLADPSGEALECKVTATNRPKKALRTLRVPRTCLGEPAWVRVSTRSFTRRKGEFRIDFGLGGGMNSSDRLTRRLRVG